METDSVAAALARPLPELVEGRFEIRFARSKEDLERVQRLRFEVFNLELREGLEDSYVCGLDRDAFDLVCDTLMVCERSSGELVGTYRMQTAERARQGLGFYCAEEFDFSRFPAALLEAGVELGRACIDPRHRNGRALFALWRGLAAYLVHRRKRYLYGCSSLTSQNESDGWRFYWQLERDGHVHPHLFVPTLPPHVCGTRDGDPRASREVKLPALFKTYLRSGAKVCSGPAIDRAFKTIDYLIVLDVEDLPARSKRVFFADLPHPPS